MFNSAKKTDLLEIANKFEIQGIKTYMRKQDVKNIIIRYFVEEEIFDETALSLVVNKDTESSEFKLRQMELQYQLEEKKLELEREKEEKRLSIEREREREREKKERKELEKKKEIDNLRFN